LYSSINRTDEYKNRLLNFVQCKYGIEVGSLIPTKRGFYGETWRLDAADTSYFLTQADTVEEYIDGWIAESFKYADEID